MRNVGFRVAVEGRVRIRRIRALRKRIHCLRAGPPIEIVRFEPDAARRPRFRGENPVVLDRRTAAEPQNLGFLDRCQTLLVRAVIPNRSVVLFVWHLFSPRYPRPKGLRGSNSGYISSDHKQIYETGRQKIASESWKAHTGREFSSAAFANHHAMHSHRSSRLKDAHWNSCERHEMFDMYTATRLHLMRATLASRGLLYIHVYGVRYCSRSVTNNAVADDFRSRAPLTLSRALRGH